MSPETFISSTLTRSTQILVFSIAVIFVAIIGKPVLCPLLFGLLAAFVLLPVAAFLERRWFLPRGISSFIAVLLLAGIMAAIFWLVWSQCAGFAKDWPDMKTPFMASLNKLQDYAASRFAIGFGQQRAYIKSATEKIMSSSLVGNALHSVSSVLLFLLFFVFDTFFLLFYRRLLMQFIISIVAANYVATTRRIVDEVKRTIAQYIVGIVIEMAIVTTACCIIFSVIGIKYAILLGLLTGLVNLIPYAGIYTAAVAIPVFTFAASGTPGQAIGVAISILCVHLLDANILLPVIVGSRVKVNAFAALTAIFAGALIWGIPGIFLAIPVLAILKIIFSHVDGLKPLGHLIGTPAKKQ